MFSTCQKEHGEHAGVCIEGMCLSSLLSLGLGRWQLGCCDNAKREEEGGIEKGGGTERNLSVKPGLSTNPLLPLREAAVLQSQPN